MGTRGYRRLAIALGLLCVGLLGLSACLFWSWAWLTAHVVLASEQTEIFEVMRVQARDAGPAKAAADLEYVVRYYPSGTKQEQGSRLDRIVEAARASAVRDIIAGLRATTGEDLGDDPEAWIRKYAEAPSAVHRN